jgi:hypothetical protein
MSLESSPIDEPDDLVRRLHITLARMGRNMDAALLHSREFRKRFAQYARHGIEDETEPQDPQPLTTEEYLLDVWVSSDTLDDADATINHDAARAVLIGGRRVAAVGGVLVSLWMYMPTAAEDEPAKPSENVPASEVDMRGSTVCSTVPAEQLCPERLRTPEGTHPVDLYRF